jgi:hypothetical protein
VSDRDEFMAWAQSRLRDAETALHNGDPGPRPALWSAREPVSVLGAWRSAIGQEEMRELFHALSRTFSDCTSHAYDIVSAEGIGTWLSPRVTNELRRRSTESRGGMSFA